MIKDTVNREFIDMDLNALGNTPLSRMLMKELDEKECRHHAALVIQAFYRERKSTVDHHKCSGFFSYL
jgi:hypothetical protein